MSTLGDGRDIAQPPAQPFKVGDPIPPHGDGELHPDVIRLRHQLASLPARNLAAEGDFAALAEFLGDDWTAERVSAAWSYIANRGRRP